MEDSGQNQIFYMAYEAILFIACLSIIVLFWKMTTGVTNDLLPEVWDNSTMSAKSYDSDYLGVRTEDNGGGTDTLYRTDGNIYVMSPEYKYNGIITGDQLVGEIMSIDAYSDTLESIYVGELDSDISNMRRISLRTKQKIEINMADEFMKKYNGEYYFENELEKSQVVGSTLSKDGSAYVAGFNGPLGYSGIRDLQDPDDVFVRYYEYDDNGNVRNIFYILQSSLADH